MNTKKETDWGNMPKSLLGWVLWAVGERSSLRKIIIVFVGIAFAVTWFLVGRQLFIIRSNEIEKIKVEIFEEQWKKSDYPEWKAALITSWYDPNKIPYNIWMDATKNQNKIVQKAVAVKSGAPNDCKQFLFREEMPSDIRLPAFLSIIKNKKELSLLINDTDSSIREVVASNNKTPQKILDRFVDDENSNVLIKTALNKNTSKETMLKLAECNTTDVILALLSRTGLPVSIFEKFSEDDREGLALKRMIAKNPETPVEILKELHYEYFGILKKEDININKDPAYLICISLASNRSTPSEFLQKFKDEFDIELFKFINSYFIFRLDYYLAGNPSTPVETLRKISFDRDYEILSQIAKNPSLPNDIFEKISNEKSNSVILGLIDNPNLPKSLLKKLATEANKNKNILLLEKIAGRPDLTAEIIDLIINQKEIDPICALAKNRFLNRDVLVKLSNNANQEVQKAVAENFNTPPEILEQYFKSKKSTTILSLAGNMATPINILKTLCYEDQDVKTKLAKNLSTPKETLIFLSSDEEEEIRLAAFSTFISKMK
jgi:hypothetical protein